MTLQLLHLGHSSDVAVSLMLGCGLFSLSRWRRRSLRKAGETQKSIVNCHGGSRVQLGNGCTYVPSCCCESFINVHRHFARHPVC